MNKKNILIGLLILFIILSASIFFILSTPANTPSTSSSPFKHAKDFRNAEWGMSMDEVVQSESLSPIEVKYDTIVYQTYLDFFGNSTYIGYGFRNDVLYSGTYWIGGSYSSPTNNDINVNEHIDNVDKIFTKINDQLIKYFGDPVSKEDSEEYSFYRFETDKYLILSTLLTDGSMICVSFVENLSTN